MFSILIAVLNILLICGLPLGELTMGGQYKVLPKKMRPIAMLSLIFQVFAIILVLQGGGYLDLWFSYHVTRRIYYVFAVCFGLNTFMNFFSKSKKEKYIMIPLALLVSIYFFVTVWQMNSNE